MTRSRWCLGPRRSTLLVLGAITANMAWVVNTEGPIDPTDAVAHQVIPLPLRVAMWAIFGGIAMLCAIPRGRRLYGQFGYAMLWAMPGERITTSLLAQTHPDYPGPPPGWDRVIPDVVVWLLVLMLLCTVMLWPDPDDEVRRATARRRKEAQ